MGDGKALAVEEETAEIYSNFDEIYEGNGDQRKTRKKEVDGKRDEGNFMREVTSQ